MPTDLVQYMLESANLASRRAAAGNLGDAVHWYRKAAYWAIRLGDRLAAADYAEKASFCA